MLNPQLLDLIPFYYHNDSFSYLINFRLIRAGVFQKNHNGWTLCFDFPYLNRRRKHIFIEHSPRIRICNHFDNLGLTAK